MTKKELKAMLAEINSESVEAQELTPAEIKAMVMEAVKGAKPEVKPEVKAEVKPAEAVVDPKPEVKPAVQVEAQLTKDDIKGMLDGLQTESKDVLTDSTVKTRTGQTMSFIKTPDVKVSGTGF